MYSGILKQDQFDSIEKTLRNLLDRTGVNHIMLIDMAGNTIASCDNGKKKLDKLAFSALAAGNFAAVDAMAQLVGETEFSLLFHKGEKASIHFSRVDDAFLLITMFDKEVSLGLVRLKVAEAIREISDICV